jgi:CheY-like chemotaxis protein
MLSESAYFQGRIPRSRTDAIGIPFGRQGASAHRVFWCAIRTIRPDLLENELPLCGYQLVFMDWSIIENECLRTIRPDQCVVLIAEDEVVVRNVARIVLESDGFYTLTAAHGQEALNISEHFPGPIHLLLSDVQMPLVNGLELMERIVVRRPDIKVILMSEKKVSCPDVPFLEKPFGPKRLRATIGSVLESVMLFPPCKNPMSVRTVQS